MCLVLDRDLFEHIGEGRAEVVTDHVDHVDATGIVLKSGKRIDADVIVTATGLQLQALGGITIVVDGAEITPTDRFVYKEYLLEDVPNMAWCIGYTNASWTLRADMTARAVAKLLAYMDSHGYTHAYPHLGGVPMEEKPTFDLKAGYIQRAPHALPKSGTHRPWNVRHNYVLDIDRPPFRPHRGVDGLRSRRRAGGREDRAGPDREFCTWVAIWLKARPSRRSRGRQVLVTRSRGQPTRWRRL